MKRSVLVLLLLLVPTLARADWKDVGAGLTPERVIACVGQPLMRTHSRNGAFETWIYDFGGCITFEGGRVAYWRAPQPPKK